MGQNFELGKVVLVLLLVQVSFGLIQENLLTMFPQLIGPLGFGLGIAGLIVASILFVRHIARIM